MLLRTIAFDERLAQLSVPSELLFLKAIPHQDDLGRMLGDPAHFRGSVLPARAKAEGWDDEYVRELMLEWLRTTDEYGTVRPLVRWGHGKGGVLVCEFPGFEKTQRLRRKGTSTLPTPDLPMAENPDAPTLFDDVRAKGSEGKGSEGKRRATPSLPAAPADEVLAIYDHWRHERGKTHPRYDEISDARRKKIQSRLREFTEDELKQAISAVALDPWEERPRHDDLTVILRSREHVERFLAFAENGSSPRPSRNARGLTPAQILALPEAAL